MAFINKLHELASSVLRCGPLLNSTDDDPALPAAPLDTADLMLTAGDGDRRDYARQQWAGFLERGGPERKRGEPAGEAATAAAVVGAAAAAAVGPSE